MKLAADVNVLLSAKCIEDRAPDDVPLLALALAMGIPVWSNDDDFRTAGVVWYTTARLLKKLGPAE